MTKNVNNIMFLSKIEYNGTSYIPVVHYYSPSGTPLPVTATMQKVHDLCHRELTTMIENSVKKSDLLAKISGEGLLFTKAYVAHNAKTGEAWIRFLAILTDPDDALVLEGRQVLDAFMKTLTPERKKALGKSILEKHACNTSGEFIDPSPATMEEDEIRFLRSLGCMRMSRGEKVAEERARFILQYLDFIPEE